MNAIEKAKTLLEMATQEQPECTCSDPNISHDEKCPWLCWVVEMPRAMGRVSALTPTLLAWAIGAVETLEGRCWHQELYEERSDGASDIYPDIMHPGACGEGTTCKPCGACQALTTWEKLWGAKP